MSKRNISQVDTRVVESSPKKLCLENKESTGLQQSQKLNSHQVLCPKELDTSKDSLNVEKPLTSSTGNLSLCCSQRLLSPELKSSLEEKVISNSLDQLQLTPTVGRRIQELKEQTSVGFLETYFRAVSLGDAPRKQIGTVYGNWRNLMISKGLTPMFVFVTGVTSYAFHNSMLKVWALKKTFGVTGAQVLAENLIEDGQNSAILHIQKIQCPNGGMVTKIKEKLLSKNFEVLLESPMYYDGSIVFLFLLKPKGDIALYVQSASSLRATYTLANGTQHSMTLPIKLLSEDSEFSSFQVNGPMRQLKKNLTNQFLGEVLTLGPKLPHSSYFVLDE